MARQSASRFQTGAWTVNSLWLLRRYARTGFTGTNPPPRASERLSAALLTNIFLPFFISIPSPLDHQREVSASKFYSFLPLSLPFSSHFDFTSRQRGSVPVHQPQSRGSQSYACYNTALVHFSRFYKIFTTGAASTRTSAPDVALTDSDINSRVSSCIYYKATLIESQDCFFSIFSLLCDSSSYLHLSPPPH